MKTDLEVLDGAIELVSANDGWCKGAFCKPRINPTSFCLEGALMHIIGNLDQMLWELGGSLPEVEQFDRLQGLILRSINDRPFRHLRFFNDADDTTQEDVILALKTACAVLVEESNKEEI